MLPRVRQALRVRKTGLMASCSGAATDLPTFRYCMRLAAISKASASHTSSPFCGK